ncbi:DNA excision repair protein ERCC-6-like [Dromiciops gliroides]|uniref:DNA excision repair protein ERCC-6-like n=1 Tax=Dromiciops gliroides TaxID=33562 RepID=UPI001CC635C8|nr:DNA excision repair protein ERCC-6-like [Dromiciops gliroides]
MAESSALATGNAAAQLLSPGRAASYGRYVKEAKEATKNGNLEEALKLFYLAKDVFPNDKVLSRIQRLEEALEKLSVEGDDEFVDVCDSGLMLYGELHDRLFVHQKEGVAFLYSLYKDRRKGGILADDMGLGKTIQIIAFLSAMFDAELVRCVLLIMPTSLISTWTKEFAKWTPGMRVATFHGSSKNERTRNLNRIQRKNGVAITTYQMLINNWQQLSQLDGKEFVWDYLILDEAHKIKSSSTKSSVAARAIPVKNRILLTGTPIQNNLYELWSLFDFACQGSLLGTSKTFKMEYENPITRAREKDATSREKALGLKISENLMMLIKPYFLRRTKEDVQKKSANKSQSNLREKNPGGDMVREIPSLSRKNELIIWVYLVPLQEEIYRKFVSLNHIKQLLTETRSPLAELTVLKKLCDHPRLLSARACSLLGLKEGNFSGGDESQVAHSDIQIEQVLHESLMQESGKMMFLMALLKRLQDEGHQTLVFSQSRKLLDIIEHLLKKENFKILRIDGTVTHLSERQRRINLFQRSQGVSVFLLTSQVGGVGLTLTAATRVVIFDPSWNPATDAQAVDRVYRIGQKENVVVYRLITCGTLEEKIYRRQVFKDSVIRQTTGDQKNPVRYFSKQELRELFAIGDFQSSATQLQLQSLHAGHRKTDEKLEEHIAYLHTLGIAGISDHDLMFTHDVSVHEESEVGESQYIQERVQKAQLLVELESQNNELLLNSVKTRVEETWLKDPASSKPKKKCSEFNVVQHPSPPVIVDLTQEDSLNSGMAGLSIAEDSEVHDLSVMNVDVSIKQSDVHLTEHKIDDECITIFSNEEGHEMEISKTNNPDDSNEVLPDNTQESVKPLARETAEADLEPNPDQPTNDEILLESSILPLSPEKSMELGTSVISLPGDLSGPNALENSGPNEAKLEKESLAASLQDAGDFNLFLEDSVESGQNPSKQSLESTERENSMWNLAANPRGENSFGYLQPENLSGQESELEDKIAPVKMRYKTRRIVSDDEDDSVTEGMLSPFPKPLLTQFSSTPKNNRFQSELFLSEICSGGNNSVISRRSLASRRSLIHVILDHVEDMEEDASEQKSMDKYLEEEEKEEIAEDSQESEHSEEEPAGETSLSQSKPCSLSVSHSDLAQSASGGDCEETTAHNPSPAPVTDEYEALVRCGKELKENGKIQEALNCLLKALDIKSTDPQVMLMTLNLYKQFNQT